MINQSESNTPKRCIILIIQDKAFSKNISEFVSALGLSPTFNLCCCKIVWLKKHTYDTLSPTTASADTLSAHSAVHAPAPPARENTVTQHTSPASLFLSLQYVLTKNQASARQGKEKQRHTSLRRVCASIREECHRLKLTQTFCVSKPRLFWNNRSSSLKQHRVLSNSQRLWAKISLRGIKPYSLQYIYVCVYLKLFTFLLLWLM